MKRFIPGIIFLIIGGVLIVALAANIDFRQVLTLLVQVAPLEFLGIIVLTFIGISIGNFRGQVILRSQGVDISFWRLLRIWFAGNAFNFSTPFVYVGGEGVKGYLLSKKLNISGNKIVSFLVIDKIIDLTASFFIAAAAVSFFLFQIGISGLTRTILLTISIIGVVVFIVALFYILVFQDKKFLSSLLKRLFLHKTRAGIFIEKTEGDIIKFFNTRSKFMWHGLAISLAKQAVFLLRHVLLVYIVTRTFQFSAALISLGALYAGFAVPIPGALGVQEGIQSILFAILELGAERGLALSFILRGVDVLLISVGIAVLLRQGVGLMTSGALYMMKIVRNNNNHNNHA